MRVDQAELKELRERVTARRNDAAALAELRSREETCRRELETQTARLAEAQRDVERLEKLSLTSILASLRGSKGADLERKQAEVHAARLDAQETERRLSAVRAEMETRRERLRESERCETRYRELLREKETGLRASDPAVDARLAELERREQDLAVRGEALKKALDAGAQVPIRVAAAEGSLVRIEELGGWDPCGGGVQMDPQKYECLHGAQTALKQVDDVLGTYRTALEDAGFASQTDVFECVGDILFDNLFADCAVMERVRNLQGRLRTVRSRTAAVQQELSKALLETEQAAEVLRTERDELIYQA